MFKFESKSEYTGNLYKDQFFAAVDTNNPEYQTALHKAETEEAAEGMTNRYIRFKKALELTKKFQPADPTNPNKPFGRDLRITLQDLLKLETEEEMDMIKFYTAVGTPLDKIHGVDAFLEVDGGKEGIFRTTFDLTTNPNKKSYKSDLIISEEDLPDPNLEEKEYLRQMDIYAKLVADRIPLNIITRILHEKRKVIFGKNEPKN